MDLHGVLDKCRGSGVLSPQDVYYLLSLEGKDDVDKLVQVADEVRREYCGSDVHVRALIEFSNYCRCNCNYCGIRAQNDKIARYRIPPEEIVEITEELSSQGLRTVVLQSGEDMHYTPELLADTIREIKERTDMAITLSVGEHEYDVYKLWKEAGADRYLLRHETANRELFESLHVDGDYDRRMQCLKWLRELGFQTGAGCMVGPPGQTVEHMAEDIMFIQDFQPDMIGIGPYIPHPETPYRSSSPGTVLDTIKMVALTRIVTRDSLIPATTAIGTLEEQGREMALMAGADVVMPNYTPEKYRKLYEIYPNKKSINQSGDGAEDSLKKRIEAIGRTVSKSHGHSRKMAKAGTK